MPTPTVIHIAIKTPDNRFTNFSKDEQISMMTLWCIFRSPLIMGGELRDNVEWTLSLLTNPEILRLLKYSYDAKQVLRTGNTVIWASNDEDRSKYVAFFNTAFTTTSPEISFMKLGIRGPHKVRNLWTHEEIGVFNDRIGAKVPIHGAIIYKLVKVD